MFVEFEQYHPAPKCKPGFDYLRGYLMYRPTTGTISSQVNSPLRTQTTAARSPHMTRAAFCATRELKPKETKIQKTTSLRSFCNEFQSQNRFRIVFYFKLSAPLLSSIMMENLSKNPSL